MMGEDSASPRYIFTKLDRFTRLLFRKEDDPLLTYLEDEGERIEPEEYVPILPIVLVNGTLGIGSGWSSNVPLYNPKDIIQCIRVWLSTKSYQHADKCELPDIHPWYKPFGGVIEKMDVYKYITKGVLSRKNDIVTVTVIPVGMSIDSFKNSLDELMEQRKIKSYKNFSTDNVPHFEIKEIASEMELTLESLKLTSIISTSNMVLFDTTHKLKKYDTVQDIIHEFCHFRYQLYIKRKVYMLGQIEKELVVLRNKLRFLTEVMSGKLVIQNVDEDDIIKTLKKTGYVTENEGDQFGYLLGMHIRSFSKQKMEELSKSIQSLEESYKVIKATTEDDMWLKDIMEFEKEFK
jgi:DNA topoisomerase-2